MSKANIFGTVLKTYTERWNNGNGETKYLVVETGTAEHSNPIALRLTGQNQDQKFDAGAKIHCTAWVDGREWNGKYITSLTFAGFAEQTNKPAEQPAEPESEPVQEIDVDDIPFNADR